MDYVWWHANGRCGVCWLLLTWVVSYTAGSNVNYFLLDALVGPVAWWALMVNLC
jgi:hypothetical protein